MGKATLTAPSPPVLVPAGNVQSSLADVTPNTPMTSTSSPSSTIVVPHPATSLTSKEWVVPPRPKPGRKPAIDAPPTKRKAQNRAAQRAFRERRAARVGELEEEIKKIEMEDEEEQNALREQIDKLQTEVEEYRTSLNLWMQRCRGLEAELAIESAAKEEALRASKETSTRRSSSSQSTKYQQELLQEGDESIGCGKCSSISDCQCIQEVINMPNLDSNPDIAYLSSNKRPHSSTSNRSNSKRIKPEPLDDLETDFTSSFSNLPSNTTREDHASPSSSSALPDLCGFCTDGTACICAEMQAAEAEDRNNRNRTHTLNRRNLDQSHNHQRSDLESEQQQQQDHFSLLPRISQLSHITPPPSENDVSLPTPSAQPSYPSSSSTNNPCINGPGTCLQCLSDPNSTLFCKSLARSRANQNSIPFQQPSGCCNAKAGAVCCQSSAPSSTNTRPGVKTRASNKTTANSLPGDVDTNSNSNSDSNTEGQGREIPAITLSCADAYTTLSRHPAYARATAKGEMERWLPRLCPQMIPPRPVTSEAGSRVVSGSVGEGGGGKGKGKGQGEIRAGIGHVDVGGRPAMEIDAANVMAVLREFDRRFS